LNSTESVKDMENSLLAVDKNRAFDIMAQFQGSSGADFVNDVLMPALESIGGRWERGEVSLSQVYMSGKISETMIDTLIGGATAAGSGRTVAVAVLEDHHNLGKKILSSVLRTGGFLVKDYGHALKAEQLADMVERDSVEYLMISTLMLPAALRIKDAVALIRERSPGTRIIVGGAPFLFDASLAEEVGADAFGRTATESLNIVKRMMQEAA